MNKQRRKDLRDLATNLQAVGSIEDLKMCVYELEELRDEEMACCYNMPENLQFSKRGKESDESIALMDKAIDLLYDIINDSEIFDEIDEKNIEDVISLLCGI